jgi:hypothetical protein
VLTTQQAPFVILLLEPVTPEKHPWCLERKAHAGLVGNRDSLDLLAQRVTRAPLVRQGQRVQRELLELPAQQVRVDPVALPVQLVLLDHVVREDPPDLLVLTVQMVLTARMARMVLTARMARMVQMVLTARMEHRAQMQLLHVLTMALQEP